MRAVTIWVAVLAALAIPFGIAATSPLLQWRQPIYIGAGFAGVIALGLLLVQPLLAAGLLPGLDLRQSRRCHAWLGASLVAAVLLHVGGLWITSPPDVIDALTFTSPTPFSAWGVISMWAVFAAALIAAVRNRLGPRRWRIWHMGLGGVIVSTTVLHAVLIEGTMGQMSKVVLCALAIGATAKVIYDRRALLLRRKRPQG